MPLALDPDETIDVSLELDKPKPEPTRPKFALRFMTCREVLKVENLTNLAYAESDQEKCSAILDQVLAISLVGWKNITDRQGHAISFSLQIVDDVLTVMEKWELIGLCATAPRVADLDKKKSILQRALPSQTSAPSAPLGNA